MILTARTKRLTGKTNLTTPLLTFSFVGFRGGEKRKGTGTAAVYTIRMYLVRRIQQNMLER